MAVVEPLPHQRLAQRRVHQAGLPSLKRSVKTSSPFATSRARMRSALSCVTFDPVISTASATLKLAPMSSKKLLGQRKTCTVCCPLFTIRYAVGFPPEGGRSLNSSTVPLTLVSVAGSYLGGPWARADTARERAAKRTSFFAIRLYGGMAFTPCREC